MADKDIKLQITTSYDGAAAKAAKADVESLAQKAQESQGAMVDLNQSTHAFGEQVGSTSKWAVSGFDQMTEATQTLSGSLEQHEAHLAQVVKRTVAAPKATVPAIGLMTRAMNGYNTACSLAGSALGKIVAPLAIISLMIESYNKIKGWFGWGATVKNDAEAVQGTAEAVEGYVEQLKAVATAQADLDKQGMQEGFEASRAKQLDAYNTSMERAIELQQGLNNARLQELMIDAIRSGSEYDRAALGINGQLVRGEITQGEADRQLMLLAHERAQDELVRQDKESRGAYEGHASSADDFYRMARANERKGADHRMPAGLLADVKGYKQLLNDIARMEADMADKNEQRAAVAKKIQEDKKWKERASIFLLGGSEFKQNQELKDESDRLAAEFAEQGRAKSEAEGLVKRTREWLEAEGHEIKGGDISGAIEAYIKSQEEYKKAVENSMVEAEKATKLAEVERGKMDVLAVKLAEQGRTQRLEYDNLLDKQRGEEFVPRSMDEARRAARQPAGRTRGGVGTVSAAAKVSEAQQSLETISQSHHVLSEALSQLTSSLAVTANKVEQQAAQIKNIAKR